MFLFRGGSGKTSKKDFYNKKEHAKKDFSKKSEEQRKQRRIVWKPFLFKRAFEHFKKRKQERRKVKREEKQKKEKEKDKNKQLRRILGKKYKHVSIY